MRTVGRQVSLASVTPSLALRDTAGMSPALLAEVEVLKLRAEVRRQDRRVRRAAGRMQEALSRAAVLSDGDDR